MSKNKFTASTVNIPIKPIIQEIVDLHNLTLEDRKVEIQFNTESSRLEEKFTFDARRLQ